MVDTQLPAKVLAVVPRGDLRDERKRVGPVFWIVLMFVVLVLAELIDEDEGFFPSGGGVPFRNRSVYGGGGGGVGK